MKTISIAVMLLTEVQTCRKPAPKEDVKELLWRDVSLKVSAEGAVVSVRVTWLGWSMTGCLCRALVSTLIILQPFLCIAEHCICIAYSWIEKKSRETQILKFSMNYIYIILNININVGESKKSLIIWLNECSKNRNIVNFDYNLNVFYLNFKM